MRRIHATLALFVLAAGAAITAAVARADGKIVPRIAVGGDVVTPDQRALLRWDEATSTETLVIETTLRGAGDEFAWIVPLPAAPVIEPSTTGLFPTLGVVTAPDVRVFPDPTWVVVVALGLGCWAAVRWWRRGLHPAIATSMAPLSLGLGCGVGLLISPPGCSATGPDGTAARGVTVLARETVGVFDTATIAAADGAALADWLGSNGFAAPQGIGAVATDYAREGWVFVAARIRREPGAAETQRIHPLAFTFRAREAVYPMRLTGVGAVPLDLELHVFGNRRAEADGLAVEHCALRDGEGRRKHDWSAHAELARRVGDAAVLTTLSGTLDAAAMAHDIRIRWTKPEAFVRVRHGVVAGVSVALLPGAWVFAALVLAFAIRSRWALDARATWFRTWDAKVFVVCVAVGLGVAGVAAAGIEWLPADAIVASTWDAPRDTPWRSPPAAAASGRGAARAWAASVAATLENTTTGGPMREEDSPGNWTVDERDGRVLLRLHAANLGAQTIDLAQPSR